MSPRPRPLAEEAADAIADDLTAGKVFVLDRRDLARRAALEGYRQGVEAAARIVAEMQADHGGDLLAEAVLGIRNLSKDEH